MSEREYRTARRFLKICRRLFDGEPHLASQLAKELEVDVRHVRMYFDAIADECDEVEIGMVSGCKALQMRPGKVVVTAEEGLGVAVSLGRQVLRQLRGTRSAARYERMFEDVDRGPGRMLRQFWRKFVVLHAVQHVTEEQAARVLDGVLEGLGQERRLLFRYVDRKGVASRRDVEPLSLVFHGDELYLAARHDGQLRVFSAYAMSDVGLGAPFAYPTDWDPATVFGGSFGIWLRDAPPDRVVLRFAPALAAYAQRHKWHNSQQRRLLPDGSVEVCFLVPWTIELRRFAMGFGSLVEVLEPAEARADVARASACAAALYRNEGEPP